MKNKQVVGNGANAGLDFWDVDARTNRNYQKPAWGAVGNYSLNQYMVSLLPRRNT